MINAECFLSPLARVALMILSETHRRRRRAREPLCVGALQQRSSNLSPWSELAGELQLFSLALMEMRVLSAAATGCVQHLLPTCREFVNTNDEVYNERGNKK